MIDKYVLRDVSFTIEKGQVLSIVGENGAGKTTLVKLLARLYDPNEGDILFNGKNLKDISPEHIRSYMSIVFQDFNHYQLLVKENIAVGDIHDGENIDRIKDVATTTAKTRANTLILLP